MSTPIPPAFHPRALDFADRAAVMAWLADVEAQLEDLAAVAADQTAPMAKRRLGRASAREQIDASRAALASSLAFARKGLVKPHGEPPAPR